MTEWRAHDGGNQPVRDTAIVIVRFRNGQERGPRPAHYWRWRNWSQQIGRTDHDIVAWRLN